MTASDFVELCKQLRELGVTSVKAHGFEVTFSAAAIMASPAVRGRPMSEDAKVLTPEEAKRAQRNRELGRG